MYFYIVGALNHPRRSGIWFTSAGRLTDPLRLREACSDTIDEDLPSSLGDVASGEDDGFRLERTIEEFRKRRRRGGGSVDTMAP